jgi:hypothetical protein
MPWFGSRKSKREKKQVANIQVVLEGKGHVTLRDSNYVATGGEGKIYKISDSVVKIYHKPDVAKKRDMPEKIRLLSKLRHPYVSSPTGLVTTPAGDCVGHYLPFVDGHALPLVFTNDFWKTQKFENKHASTLVARMREIVSFAHQNKALMVDANELNYFALFSGSDPEPRVIDVDSWAIGKWPATVIMPSIRDWHAKSFDEKTDWFAWGIVTFQVYTGLHPYKGTLDGFDRGDLEGRMKANASVFSTGVRLNRAVREFSTIPSALLNWYEATFQNGERVEPPSPFDTGITAPKAARTMRVVTVGRSQLVFEKIYDSVQDPALRVFHCGVAILTSGKLIDISTKRQIGDTVSTSCEIVKVQGGWLVAELNQRTATVRYIEEGSFKSTDMSLKLTGYNLVSYENRLFVVMEAGLTELTFHFGSKPIVSASINPLGAMLNSTKWFQGVGVMDAMGAMYLITPYGDSFGTHIRVRELDGLKIVTAKAGNRFVSLIGVDKTGVYKKIEVTLDRDYKSYTIWAGDTDGPELNIAILPKGVCATIVRDGEVNIFVPVNGQMTRIEDSQIGTDMLLANWLNKVVYIQNGAVWSLSMK